MLNRKNKIYPITLKEKNARLILFMIVYSSLHYDNLFSLLRIIENKVQLFV
jgi:hypothetical protein